MSRLFLYLERTVFPNWASPQFESNKQLWQGLDDSCKQKQHKRLGCWSRMRWMNWLTWNLCIHHMFLWQRTQEFESSTMREVFCTEFHNWPCLHSPCAKWLSLCSSIRSGHRQLKREGSLMVDVISNCLEASPVSSLSSLESFPCFASWTSLQSHCSSLPLLCPNFTTRAFDS